MNAERSEKARKRGNTRAAPPLTKYRTRQTPPDKGSDGGTPHGRANAVTGTVGDTGAKTDFAHRSEKPV